MLRACRGSVIVVVTDPRSGLFHMFFVAYGDCTNDLGRGEAMLMCRSPVAGERSLVAGFSFWACIVSICVPGVVCAIVVATDPPPGLSRTSLTDVW